MEKTLSRRFWARFFVGFLADENDKKSKATNKKTNQPK